MGNAARNSQGSTARRRRDSSNLPLSLMQSLGLPLPNLDHDDDAPPLKTSKIWRLREMVMKRMKKKVRGRNEEEESSGFSSICSSSSTFSSATSLFCCSPWNIPPILEEGNTRIYYCSLHKNAFAVEEGDLFMSGILSAAEHFSGQLHGEVTAAGVPFGWEMHPGKPKAAVADELIPPPSPPPVAQSLTLPPAGRDDKAKKGWFWIRRGIGCGKQHEISFKYNENWSVDTDASLRKTESVSSSASIAPLSRGGGWRVSKIRRNLEGSLLRCGPWSTRELLVFARRKWKSLAS